MQESKEIAVKKAGDYAGPPERRHSTAYASHGYPERFITHFNEIITQAQEERTLGAFFLLNIDNMAMMMSGYGLEVAERMMLQITETIRGIIGKGDAIERIQRDQFGIVLNQVDPDQLHYLAERIISAIQLSESPSHQSSLHALCSVAAITYPDQTNSAQDAMSKSFVALNENAHDNIAFYDSDTPDYSENDRQEMGLANYLKEAIQEERLKLAYQPIICSKTGAISHYEALLRLHSDDGKISSAEALIPIAERMGLIDLVDEITLNMVIEDVRRDPNVRLAFNVSNLTTRNPKWLDTFSTLIDETPEIADRLIVEITETAAQLDLRRTAFFVAEIQSLGAEVALDDFGSGYTSFRQLKTLSVDMVKIDGSFIRDLVDNADNRFFVKTLLDFTKGFGLKSVAEFVESGEIAKMLMELGVDCLQGYYLGKPENHRSWLDNGEYKSD